MVAALLIAFREGLEAALIVGIVLSYLKKIGYKRQAAVWWGVASAVTVSVVAGVALQALGVAFEGRGEELFEGITMLLAAGVLTWMIFWMQRQGRSIRAELEADVRQAVTSGSRWALFALAFVAVVREGIETALFLTAAAFSATPAQTLIGGGLGLALAVAVGWLLFVVSVRLDVRAFFRVTSVLLILFAAGLVAHGVHELQEAGVVPVVVEHVWDINPVPIAAGDSELRGLLPDCRHGHQTWRTAQSSILSGSATTLELSRLRLQMLWKDVKCDG